MSVRGAEDASAGIVVRGISKRFGSQPVLRQVDLVVPEGSVTTILGPSGSGKTTLLRLLAGFERPEEGSISIGGAVVEDTGRHVPPEARRLGYVPQEGSLFPHLDVSSNIGFGLPRSGRHARVAELLEMTGLTRLSRRFPHQLSGGQQQRVALARALAIRPSVVLLDEPFSSLDASLRAGLRRDVTRILEDTGTTAILVTHDQDEALAVSDQIVVLREGRVVAQSDPHGLYHEPPDLEAATSIGEANVLPAEVRGGCVISVLGAVPLRRAPSADGGGAVGERMGHPGRQPAGVDEGLGQLLVRPEQLVLDSQPIEGATEATVVDTQYFGHDALVRVAVDDSERSVLLARVPGEHTFTEGQRVWVEVVGSVSVWPGRARKARLSLGLSAAEEDQAAEAEKIDAAEQPDAG